MIVLFAITSWIFSIALVTGLCLAARRGELQTHGDLIAEPAGDPIERVVVVREVAAHPSGRAAVPNAVSQPAACDVEDRTVRPEDSSPRHSQTPGDLALQPG